MKSLKKIAILAALLGAAVVEAQTAPPPITLSAAEMRVQAEQIKKQIDEDLRHVMHLQALARKEKDVIKLTCINDKLLQIKAQMDLYDTANLQLQSTLGSSDETARSSFTDVKKSGDDVARLRSEAQGCAGELELYKQESGADVERPPDLDDPTTGGGFEPPDFPEIEPPGYATPFK